MAEFLRKFESCGYKIALFNSIHLTKSINLLYFFTVWVMIEGIFWAQSIYREVYDSN